MKELQIIKVILICRIGKGIPYNEGVSPNGKAGYDRFLSLLGDANIINVILAMHSNEVRASLTNSICQKHMINVLELLKANAISDRVQEILDFLISRPKALSKIHLDTKYKEITKNHISWK